MARTYKRPSIVSGKSVQDILNIDIQDFNRLGLSDLREVVGRLVSAGNKRIRTFLKAGEPSPALYAVAKSMGYDKEDIDQAKSQIKESGRTSYTFFSTKGKNLNQLRAEFIKVKNFLEAETGTLKGWRKVRKDTISTLKSKYRISITDEQFDKFWWSYERLKEIDRSVATKKMKYLVLRELANEVQDEKKSIDDIVGRMVKRFNLIYEANEEKQNGVSGFFDID